MELIQKQVIDKLKQTNTAERLAPRNIQQLKKNDV